MCATESKCAKSAAFLRAEDGPIQRHSSGIKGIISPTPCQKCMQHASEWQEQWPLSLPCAGAGRRGGASWESRRGGQARTVGRWMLQGGLAQNPGNKRRCSKASRSGPRVSCVLCKNTRRARRPHNGWVHGRKKVKFHKCDGRFSLVYDVQAHIRNIECNPSEILNMFFCLISRCWTNSQFFERFIGEKRKGRRWFRCIKHLKSVSMPQEISLHE